MHHRVSKLEKYSSITTITSIRSMSFWRLCITLQVLVAYASAHHGELISSWQSPFFVYRALRKNFDSAYMHARIQFLMHSARRVYDDLNNNKCIQYRPVLLKLCGISSVGKKFTVSYFSKLPTVWVGTGSLIISTPMLTVPLTINPEESLACCGIPTRVHAHVPVRMDTGRDPTAKVR